MYHEVTAFPQATFAFNTGPLTWSVLAFRNSLVFHDLDKVLPPATLGLWFELECLLDS